MAGDPAVQPLRISKTTPASTPKKAGPLAELGDGSQRRNSPSYNQATRKMIVTREASPFQDTEKSPRMPASSNDKKSPLKFWADRENLTPSRVDSESSLLSRSPSPGTSPTRRPSVEKLLSAGRVRGSNIFALETKDAYDPSSLPLVERPTANRPLSQQVANNTFHRYDSLRKENSPLRGRANSPERPYLEQLRSKTDSDLLSLSSSKHSTHATHSPEKLDLQRSSPSPTKSSIARTSMFDTSFDAELGTWSDGDESGRLTPRPRSAHQKSVTFDTEHTINEYEQQTPEPSLSANSREGSWDTEEYDQEDYSFERGSSAEGNDSFDADLENADKTPVVLPEHWSRMSPHDARMDLVDAGDDVFEGSPEPTPRGGVRRSESVTSDGSTRPLPPIPGLTNGRRDSASLAAVAERASRLSTGLPRPPKRASCSKEEILGLTKKPFIHGQGESKPDESDLDDARRSSRLSIHEKQEEFIIKNLDTGEKKEIHVHQREVTNDVVLEHLDSFAAPRISRESILKKVRGTKYDFEDDSSDPDDSSIYEETRPNYAEFARYDPDQPVPSRENSHETGGSDLVVEQGKDEKAEIIKTEPSDDSNVDMADIPEASQPTRSPSRMDVFDGETSVLYHSVHDDSEDTVSRYSTPEENDFTNEAQKLGVISDQNQKETLDQAMGLLSVTEYDQLEGPSAKLSREQESFMGLPAYSKNGDYDFGMNDYITPSPPPDNDQVAATECAQGRPVDTPIRKGASLETPSIPFGQEQARGSLDSVIYKPENPDLVPEASLSVGHDDNEEIAPASQTEQSEIPERRSTIRTSGKLKTRPSASRQELEALRLEIEEPVPQIPAAYRGEDSQVVTGATSAHTVENEADASITCDKHADDGERLGFSLDIGTNFNTEDGLGDLNREFDRVIETQKNGYITRHNAKIIVASTRNFSNETAESDTSSKLSTQDSRPVGRGDSKSSARQVSAEQWMKTEPWNGKARRKSLRNASLQAHAGPMPPLPGQESALGVVDEDYATQATDTLDGEVADGVERGRLFVKVVSVKDLDLPLPRNDRLYFQLTLDNGLHCVTTSNLELNRNAVIGQEFELVVLNDLEFQLTLTTKLPPASKPSTPTESRPKSPQKSKQSAFSKLLATPKRRAERERQEREAQEAEERKYKEELRRKRASIQPTPWDMLRELVNGNDGSFARSYIHLAAHDKECFGRPLTVDVPCYNEWALEKDEAVVSSVRSKGRSRGVEVRRPPYIIGKLELQLLYVPKPKGVDDEAMPKSMKAAIREMSKASETVEASYEGYLSQQGGDCTHWRRRFFRLQGTRLTAYHEHTNQKRAVINLTKASRLVDDRRTLVADQTSTSPKKKGRRKSAFAEEDEAYQYVEEGFRLRFANGETIDFYADSKQAKDLWMDVLSQVIGKPDPGQKKLSWTDIVLAREKLQGSTPAGSSSPVKPASIASSPKKSLHSEVSSSGSQRPLSDRKPVAPLRGGSKSAPSSPVKGPPSHRAPDPPANAHNVRPLSGVLENSPPLGQRKGHRTRNAVKSMIF